MSNPYRLRPAMLRFGDLKPGEGAILNGVLYVKIDKLCEFAEHIDGAYSMAVAVGTGVLTFIGPDTEVHWVTPPLDVPSVPLGYTRS